MQPDVIFVPMVGWDLQGNRMGRGMGWYDRVIQQTRTLKPVQVIGVAWEGTKIVEWNGWD